MGNSQLSAEEVNAVIEHIKNGRLEGVKKGLKGRNYDLMLFIAVAYVYGRQDHVEYLITQFNNDIELYSLFSPKCDAFFKEIEQEFEIIELQKRIREEEIERERLQLLRQERLRLQNIIRIIEREERFIIERIIREIEEQERQIERLQNLRQKKIIRITIIKDVTLAHFICHKIFLLSEHEALYKVKAEKIVQSERQKKLVGWLQKSILTEITELEIQQIFKRLTNKGFDDLDVLTEIDKSTLNAICDSKTYTNSLWQSICKERKEEYMDIEFETNISDWIKKTNFLPFEQDYYLNLFQTQNINTKEDFLQTNEQRINNLSINLGHAKRFMLYQRRLNIPPEPLPLPESTPIDLLSGFSPDTTLSFFDIIESCTALLEWNRVVHEKSVIDNAFDIADSFWEGYNQNLFKDDERDKKLAYAIIFYTLGQSKLKINPEDCIYKSLNNDLISRDPSVINTWDHYLYYLLEGLERCPEYQGQVYRGIKSTVNNERYKPGNLVIWVAFTSTSRSVRKSLSFCRDGNKYVGTLMIIDSLHGKDISTVSTYQDEEEILFSPNSNFVVQPISDEMKMNFRRLNIPLELVPVIYLKESEKGFK